MKFVDNRRFAYIAVVVVLLSGILFYFINGGFNLSITFTGGTEITYATDTVWTNAQTEGVTKEIFGTLKKNAIVQTSSAVNATIQGTTQQVHKLVVRVGSEQTLTPDQVKIVHQIVEKYGKIDSTKTQTTNIQPSLGAEALRNGLLAVLLTLILIVFYIAVRFKQISGFSAGVIATVAILIDALMLLAVYLVFKIQLNESFIAAVLTAVAYSINDKIIVFDRIRENSIGRKKVAIEVIVDDSIMQTLTRSIYTAVTALICITVVLIASIYFGIPAITEFAFPMGIGIIFGCLTSIFIAAPAFGAYKAKHVKAK